MVIVLTKSDLTKLGELEPESRKAVEDLAKESNAYLIQMSNISGDGIHDVKSRACDILLDHRLTQKAKDPKKAEAIMSRLHVAQPKKRDNVDRPVNVPQTVLDGVKKTGPTVKELQEEFGGAGVFYIPTEEHYQLENDEWKYDSFPEFFNGKNVLDFYDKDIEEKIIALEKEEEKLLKIEVEEDKIWAKDAEDSENSDDVDFDMLKTSLAGVRAKKAVLKMKHKFKAKLRARPKNLKLSEMHEAMTAKGIVVDKEALRARSKSRRTLMDLEDAQDKMAHRDLSSDDEPLKDKKLNKVEVAAREGRSKKRARGKSVQAEDYADDVDMKGEGSVKAVKEHKMSRTLTPAQRNVSVKKLIRDRSASRREGNEPARLPYKLVPEEQIRLAKKINKIFKHKVNISESDRVIQCKKPKHLFAGKMGNGTSNKR